MFDGDDGVAEDDGCNRARSAGKLISLFGPGI